MKKRPSLIILASTLTLLNGGCGSPSDNQAPPSPSPSVAPTPPSPPSPSPQSAAPSTGSPDAVALGLIPSTQPNQRRQEISSGRTNPFALIPLRAIIHESVCQIPLLKPEAAQAATAPSNQVAQIAKGNKSLKTSNVVLSKPVGKTVSDRKTAKTQASSTQASQRSARATSPVASTGSSSNPLMDGITSIFSSPQSAVASPVSLADEKKEAAIVAKAPVLIPREAQAVEVSGVLEMGNKPYAIVKAPGEPVARYVTTGASLSNGKIRVTSIDTNPDSAGIRVEQYGIAVSRAVGQPPETSPESPPPQLNDGYSSSDSVTGRPVQVRAQLPVESNRVVPTFQSVPKGPISVSLIPPDKSGFGEVRDLSLLSLKVQGGQYYGSSKSSGIICNAGKDPIKVKQLTLQIEDKTSESILDSLTINFPNIYTLKYGQKLEFDGSGPDFRGRNLKNITVKLVDWSAGEKSAS